MIKQSSKHKQTFCFLVLCFISCCSLSSLSAAEENPQKKLQLVKQELIQINQDLKKTEKTKNQQIEKIQAFDVEIVKLHKKLGKTEARKSVIEKELKTLKKKSVLLTKNINTNKKNLTEMTRALYLRNDDNYLKIILNHNDAGEQSRMRMYYEYIYQTFTEKQTKLTADLSELAVLDVALAEKLRDYDGLLEALKKETAALKVERKNKKSYLATLDKQIQNKRQQISSLKSSQQTLEKLIKALKQRQHREEMERLSGMSFAKHKGRLEWPVNGKVRRKYGQQRARGGLKWRGILISAEMGEKVKAVDGGTVVFADWLSGYGFVLIIDHGKGYMSLYGHNQQLLKEVGEKVKAGSVIAEAGNSGRLGKPGLYFEIRRNGKPVNPAQWMSARKAG